MDVIINNLIHVFALPSVVVQISLFAFIKKKMLLINMDCKLEHQHLVKEKNYTFYDENKRVKKHHANMSVYCIPPYTPLFIVKLGFTGVNIIFFFLL